MHQKRFVSAVRDCFKQLSLGLYGHTLGSLRPPLKQFSSGPSRRNIPSSFLESYLNTNLSIAIHAVTTSATLEFPLTTSSHSTNGVWQLKQMYIRARLYVGLTD